MVAGSCAIICVGEVESSGIATSSTSTHDPPSTVGAGSVLAVAVEARLVPLISMNAPGANVDDPLVAFITAFEPAVAGVVADVVVAVGITLSPERVMAYATPFASTTIWRAGIGVRVDPNRE